MFFMANRTKTNVIRRVFFLLSVFAIITLIQCQKGGVGPQGEQGAAGQQGPAGQQGQTGTANVIHSDWFRPADTDWIETDMDLVDRFSYDIAAPGVTQNILDSGVVLVYAKLLQYPDWIWASNEIGLLPVSITYWYLTTKVIDIWSALPSPGNIRVNFQRGGQVPFGNNWFRYIIIPGGVLGGIAAPTNPSSAGNRTSLTKQLKNMNYEEVCRLFDIPL
jgi:hypothetical protein